MVKLATLTVLGLMLVSSFAKNEGQYKVKKDDDAAYAKLDDDKEVKSNSGYLKGTRSLQATMCGCSSCTSSVLNRIAEGHSIRNRINWVKANTSRNENQACELVCGAEYPSICASQCNPNQCNNNGGGGGGGGGSCTDTPRWYDIDGSQYNCQWYSQNNRCRKYGNSYENFGKTANEACCACGGGSKGGAPSPSPPPSPPSPTPPTGSLPAKPFNQGLNSIIRGANKLPYLFDNKSRYTDNEIFIAVIGIVNGQSVWADLSNNSIKSMSSTFNTVPGPSGDPTDWKYANVFTKLSDISSSTIGLPKIAACKMFISFKKPLYLHFHAAGGYSQPNLENPTDPNKGIRFETIELTWAPNGLWINTSRVDAYQYPMGLEVYGNNVGGAGQQYKKVGELKSHEDIISLWPARTSSPFQSCYVGNNVYPEGDGIIKQPSKIPAFDEGGANRNYFQGYINEIWDTYKTRDLRADFGDLGVWSGRVARNNVFTMTRVSNGGGGPGMGRINGVPNTQMAIEAKGLLASGSEGDKNVQKMFSAAINRHALNPNLPSSVTQELGNSNQYFLTPPYNDYVKFFHGFDISHNSETYAFAYDDVFDQSSTIQASGPSDIRITIGGFSNVA